MAKSDFVVHAHLRPLLGDFPARVYGKRDDKNCISASSIYREWAEPNTDETTQKGNLI